MEIWAVVCIGLLCLLWGMVIGSIAAFISQERNAKRLKSRQRDLQQVLDLEARRIAHDNQREHLPRHSESPAKVHSAKPARPARRKRKPDLP